MLDGDSGDMRACLLPWFDVLKQNGGIFNLILYVIFSLDGMTRLFHKNKINSWFITGEK